MKKYVSLILALMLLFSLAACGNQGGSDPEPAGPEMKEAVGVTIPAFSLNVNGTVLTDKELADYAVYEIKATSVNSSGTESTVTYVGFSIKDVFAAAGVGEFTTLAAIADDGYTVEVSAELANQPSTLVAITRDGEQFKSAPWFAPCSSGTTGDYLKGMVAISLDGKELDLSSGGDEPAPVEPSGELPEIQDKTDKVEFADYSFKVNGADVTNATLEGLSIYKITVTVVNSKGSASEATYTGYKLADVLAACGVEGATKVSAVANDGYAAELAAEWINSDYTLVAIEKDKETGEDGTIWVAPCESTTSGDYAKLVVEITAE